MAGIVGWSRVSPSAKTEAQAATKTVADAVPGEIPLAASSAHEVAQTADITTITRVRRRPSIRWSTTSWSSTITRVFAANANPRPRVETSPITREYAG